MRMPAPLTFVIVLATLELIASCSASPMLATGFDDTEFVGVAPIDMNWTPLPDREEFLTVILVGNPADHGPLVARYDIPPNAEVVPHTHREIRGYTVISGEWGLGFGEVFDPGKLQAYPQGSYYRLPAGVPHFQKAGPEGAIIQIESIGPDTFDPVE